MAQFVHLTSEKNVKAIERSGIALPRRRGHGLTGVFAMPVLRNYYLSHQWLRELKRDGQRLYCAIYFRIPDAVPVWVGHFGRPHQQMTAAEASACIGNADSAEGYEIIIPRKIEANEIRKVRHLSQVLGWRYRPDSHKLDRCFCRVCTPPGSIKGRKKNQAFEARM